MTPTHAPPAPPPAEADPGRGTAALLLLTGCLALAPLPVLGPAIGWPTSLGASAEAQLLGIARAPQAVAAGYGLYLLYSVLVLPALALAAHRLLGARAPGLVLLVTAFAALSTLARCIGILRWLTVMPELAQAHAGADAAQRQQLELVFNALQAYGGGVGELLGVSLFAGVALLLLVAGAAWRAVLPGWLSVLGALAVLAQLALMLPPLGLPLDPPVAAAVTSLSLWMWALAAWLFWRPRP
jgi:hypothetical protein